MSAVAFLFTSLPAAAGPPAHWVVSWGTSPSPPPAAAQIQKRGFQFKNQTLREIIHLSIGGAAIRVRFSNLFGKQTLQIGSAHLALRATESSVRARSDRALTFGGLPGIAILPNASVVSDPVNLAAPAQSDLGISIFLPTSATASAIHYLALQTSYVGSGDQPAALSISNPRATNSWIFLAGVDVSAPPTAAAIAAFGDSRADGDGSTADTNQRLPDAIARRLLHEGLHRGVLNAGIIGNRLLHDSPQDVPELGVSGLSRFDRDALEQPGVRYVIVFEGIVDIGLPGTPFANASEAVSVEDLAVVMKQLAQRAHDRGMKIFIATQTPFAGATSILGIYSPEKDGERKAFNEWIRSNRAFDGVIDFDKAVRDPSHPEAIRAEWDAGDHIHASDAGNATLAKSIDLSLLK